MDIKSTNFSNLLDKNTSLNKNNKINAIILAGGKSKRMGEDKLFLVLNGMMIIEHILIKLADIVNLLYISAKEYAKFKKVLSSKNLQNFKDRIIIIKENFKEYSPVFGIYTGLIKSNSFYNLVIAGDMPFINIEVLKFLIKISKSKKQVAFVYNSKIQPFPAIFSKLSIPYIEFAIKNRLLKLTYLYYELGFKFIDFSDIIKFDPELLTFKNLNTKNDYAIAIKKFSL